MPQDMSHQLASSGTTTLGQTYSPLSPAHIANPYAFYAHARKQEPIFFSPFLNAWIVTRYADIITVLRDHQHFAAALTKTGVEKIIPEVIALLGSHPLMQTPSLVSLDPPEHTRLRGCLTKAFSAQRIASLEPQIRTLANRLIDRIASQGHMDFMKCFASSYPIQVIGSLLNVPESAMASISVWEHR